MTNPITRPPFWMRRFLCGALAEALLLQFLPLALRAEASSDPAPAYQAPTQPVWSLNAGGAFGVDTGPVSASSDDLGGVQAGLEYRPTGIPGQFLGFQADYEHLDVVQNGVGVADNDFELALHLLPLTYDSASLTLLGGIGANATPNAVNTRWLAFLEPGFRVVAAPYLAVDGGVRFELTSPYNNTVQSVEATLGISIPLGGPFTDATAAGSRLPVEQGYGSENGGATLSESSVKYPPFLIGPGDTVTVTVYGERDLSSTPGQQSGGGSFLVDSEGVIVYPLVGPIRLGGLSQVQASQVLAKALGRYLLSPQVTVSVSDSSQYTVSVMGNVAKPGKYLIRGLPTLLGALAEAGGPLPDTDLNGTVLVRQGRSYQVPLGKYIEPTGLEQQQPLIYPGDVVYVPASNWPNWGEWGVIAGILSDAALLISVIPHK